MAKGNKQGYLTREESVVLARKVRLNPHATYVLVGLYHLATGTAIARLYTEEQIEGFYKAPTNKDYHMQIIMRNIKWGKVTQKDLADSMYRVCNNGQLQQLEAGLARGGHTTDLGYINKLPYPIKTKKGLFIGDPCYVIPDEQWSDYVDAYLEARDRGYAHFNFNGVNVGGTNTAYGDGEYYDDEDNSYPVDAGLIGVTPLELLSKVRRGMGLFIQGEFEARIEYNDGDIEIYINGRNPIIISTKEEGGYY